MQFLSQLLLTMAQISFRLQIVGECELLHLQNFHIPLFDSVPRVI